jgi:hypothetical protein
MKTVSELLTSSPLKSYLEKAEYLNKLNSIFETIIPPDFISNCKIANFEGGRLTLYVTNSGWATRIRYAIPSLMNSLKKDSHFALVSEIKCKVIPDLLLRP